MVTEKFLSNSRVVISGESKEVSDALARCCQSWGAATVIGDDFAVGQRDDESQLIIITKYYHDDAATFSALKIKRPSTRIVLLHEIADRGKIEPQLLRSIDQILEKPFTLSQLEKAIVQMLFLPLKGKTVLFLNETNQLMIEELLNNLGATVHNAAKKTLPDKIEDLSLAIFAPAEISTKLKETIRIFRDTYPDTAIIFIYDTGSPGSLDSNILSEVAYLFQLPLQRSVLRKKIIDYFEQPLSERRKNPRKHGISQCWISSLNTELGIADFFESPFLIDLSQNGISFQSHLTYQKDQMMIIWIVVEDSNEKIIELRGQIRWIQTLQSEAANSTTMFKYGIEFQTENSEAYNTFARMIASHQG